MAYGGEGVKGIAPGILNVGIQRMAASTTLNAIEKRQNNLKENFPTLSLPTNQYLHNMKMRVNMNIWTLL